MEQNVTEGKIKLSREEIFSDYNKNPLRKESFSELISEKMLETCPTGRANNHEEALSLMNNARIYASSNCIDRYFTKKYSLIRKILKEEKVAIGTEESKAEHESMQEAEEMKLKEEELVKEMKEFESNECIESVLMSKLESHSSGIVGRIEMMLGDPKTFKVPDIAEEIARFAQKFFKIHTLRGDKSNETWISVDGIESPNGASYVLELTRCLMKSKYSKRIGQLVLDKVNVDTLIEQEEYFQEADSRYIPMLNGVYDLEAKKVIPHPRDQRFFNRIPVEYDENADCPNFKKHLNEVLIDDKDILQMQEIFGFSLYRDYCFEKSFLWIGDGRNGKGKTGEVLGKLVGVKNVVSVNMHSITQNRFSAVNLHRKYVNLVGEMEQKEISATDMFKAVTGGDRITADRKNLSAMGFRNYAKWINMANEIPDIRDKTFAFFNRVELISFPYTFIPKTEYDLLSPEQIEKGKFKIADPEHIRKLTTEDEIRGVFNWALEGLYRLFRNRGFTTSKTTEETKMLILRKSNNFLEFKDKYLTEDWDSWIPKKELRYAYMMHCKRHKLNPVTEKKIYSIVKGQMGIDGAQKMNKDTNYQKLNVWDGLKFKPEIEELYLWGEDNDMTRPTLPEIAPRAISMEELKNETKSTG